MSGFVCADSKKRKDCFFKRSSGVLMNISSLPGDFAVGTVGAEARRFADFLAEQGFTYWQILPINPVGSGNSPYSSDGAFAGNLLYIDPFILYTQGLISKETLEKCKYKGSPYVADYNFAFQTRIYALTEAFENADAELLEEVFGFGKENPHILEYAKFCALSKVFTGKPIYLWDETVLAQKDVDFYLFVQYMFHAQWTDFKSYANSKGIYLIGDMPFYVGLESADVYANRSLFKVDEKFVPKEVAGVPPDYFSEDGQLWGNPIYDWKEMKKDDFNWWIRRIENGFKYHDIIRIDHFRAFASYWSIPADATSAKEGEWVKGPRMSFFKVLKEHLGDLPIIAEDLGEFGEDVEKLLSDTRFPGMRVVQFGISAEEDSSHMPHNYPENSVAYTGTHDNNTLLGYLWELTAEERAAALRYCSAEDVRWEEGGFHSPGCRKLIETVWRSSSRVAIIPFQDMCGFGGDTRMNVPGVAEGNWCYRTTEDTINNIDKEYFKTLNRVFKR